MYNINILFKRSTINSRANVGSINTSIKKHETFRAKALCRSAIINFPDEEPSLNMPEICLYILGSEIPVVDTYLLH